MRKLLIISLFILSFFSCKKKEFDYPKERIVFSKKIHHINEITIPKKIRMNDTLIGELIFDIELDSIIKSRLIKRHTYLYVTTEELDTLNARTIQNVNHNTFIDTLLRGEFKFFSKIEKRGERIISFVIEDNLLLKPKDTMNAVDLVTFEYARKLNLNIKE